MDSPKQKNTGTEEPRFYELEDLWKKADEGESPNRVMSFEETDQTKAQRS